MIPKVIHQTWKNADVPGKWIPYQDSWKKHNPDYEYKFWTDQDIDVFMKNHFNDYYDFFCGLTPIIKKVDIFRYCLMYREGGIYADMDMECLKPIHEIIEGHEVVVGKTTKANTALRIGYPDIEIAFLASAPQLELWCELLDFIRKKEASRFNWILSFFSPSFSALLITGPNTFSDFLKRHEIFRKQVTQLPPAYLFPKPWGDPTVPYKDFREKGYIGNSNESYAIHHFSSSWMSERTVNFIYHFQKYSYFIIVPIFIIIISLFLLILLRWWEIF